MQLQCTVLDLNLIQECIPVGCILSACQPYMFRWPPLDVSTGWGGGEVLK